MFTIARINIITETGEEEANSNIKSKNQKKKIVIKIRTDEAMTKPLDIPFFISVRMRAAIKRPPLNNIKTEHTKKGKDLIRYKSGRIVRIVNTLKLSSSATSQGRKKSNIIAAQIPAEI